MEDLRLKHKFITVTYQGNLISVFEAVAKVKNLKDGHKIQSESEFWEVLMANNAHGILICTSKLQPQN